MVNADLLRLQSACLETCTFTGGVDLARLAKTRGLIRDISKCGLGDLCALVLKKRLDKSTPIRMNEQWENAKLTPKQLEYAAKDACVSFLIYEQLMKLAVPTPISKSDTLRPYSSVLVYNSDNTTIIAKGKISNSTHVPIFDDLNITSLRMVVDISEVLVPGAIISTHHKRSLQSFGLPPFSIVCLRSHVRLCSNSAQLLNPPRISSTPVPSGSSAGTVQQLADVSSNNPMFDTSEEPAEGESVSVAELWADDISESSKAHNDPADLANVHQLEENIDQLPLRIEDPQDWLDQPIRSRVLKDVWHVFHMFYLSVTHGVRKEFTRELRDAIFIPDEEDRARINAWGAQQSPLQTYESLRNSSPQFVRRHCKHIIPPPHILYPLVANVFKTYGPLVDPKTKKPLFSTNNWQTANNILSLIKDGYLSDPPGIPLYTIIGIDSTNGGLPLYRCARGTNTTEGGVHTHIRSRLPKFGTTIRHVNASLLDYVLRHNILVCFTMFQCYKHFI